MINALVNTTAPNYFVSRCSNGFVVSLGDRSTFFHNEDKAKLHLSDAMINEVHILVDEAFEASQLSPSMMREKAITDDQ